MSLLIKALDKAQDAKVKQAQADADKEKLANLEQANKTQDKRAKSSKEALKSSNLGEGLTLSPPETQLVNSMSDGSDLSAASASESTTPSLKKEQVPNEMTAKAPEVLSLKPTQKTATITPNQSATKAAANPTQTQAANVFASKRIEATNQNAKLAIILGAGLIVLLAIGLYYYQFVDTEPVVKTLPPRPPQVVVVPAPPTPAPVEVASVVPESPPLAEEKVSPQSDITQAFEPKEPVKIAQKQNTFKQKNTNDVSVDTESTLDANEVVIVPTKKSTKSNVLKMDKAIASESASIQVTQSKPQAAVNPLVMRAYEAYNAGNDSEAQKLYKQVLQRDGLNLDALLGLGAIATRQGRVDDANGWYRKVLDVDPKNSTAQTALVDLQQQQDPQSSESRLKSLVARSPNDANLHAALGNLYAEQNQWSAAQQAYFDAFRLNESADNAFNLAVSLDQMGKPKLALPYYQQALQMAQQFSASNIDKAALEARIAAIQ